MALSTDGIVPSIEELGLRSHIRYANTGSFAPGPLNRCAPTAWAMPQMISFQSELHEAFQTDLRFVHRRCEREAGRRLKQTTVNALGGSFYPTREA
jgi:hypothetical protein